MKISRIELDGAGSPAALVSRILKLEPTLKPPIPVEQLARQLDIEDIKELEADGVEGALLTDEDRRSGIILVNEQARGGRRRFTVGHELAHFLIMAHKPVKPGEFLCSRRDMARWSAKENDRYAQMEFEANEFAALLLMPPPMLQSYLGGKSPDLGDIERIANDFGASKDAAARSYARHHHERVAIVVVKDGQPLRYYQCPRFPFITAPLRKPVPSGTVFYRRGLAMRTASDIVETVADNWIDVRRGQRAPTLYEQVYLQANGFALIMLWLEEEPDAEDEADDRDAGRTAKQRLEDRLARWRG